MSENIISPIVPTPVPRWSDIEGSTQPIVTPVVPVIPPTKKIPTFLLFLIPILLIVAVISIYVLFQARKMYQESIAVPSPAPTSSADPTANWQTYTNEKYQFSIKYPDDFSLEEIESAGYREFGVKFINENTKENLFIEIVGNTKTNYDQLSKSYRNNDAGWFNNPSIQYTENLETTIANLNAKTFKSVVNSQIGDSNSTETTFFFVDSQNYNFILSYRRPLEENTTQEDLTFPDQIISTFKFTETSSDDSTDLKSLTNTKYKYKIKYPQNIISHYICEGEGDNLYFVTPPVEEKTEPQNCARDSRFSLEIVGLSTFPTEDDRYFVTESNEIVDGVTATRKSYTQKPNFEGPGGDWYATVDFQKNGLYYQAYVGNKELLDTFNQIIKTFQFTN